MVPRKIVPILLIAGAVMMILHHGRHKFATQIEGGEKRDPRGERSKRIPPMFEKWHQRAHEQEAQAAAI